MKVDGRRQLTEFTYIWNRSREVELIRQYDAYAGYYHATIMHIRNIL